MIELKKRVISAIIMLLLVVPILFVGGIPYGLAVGVLGCLAYRELIELRENNKNDYPNVMKLIGLVAMLYIIYNNFEQYGLLFGLSYKLLSFVVLAIFVPVVIYKDRYNIKDAFSLFSKVVFLGVGFSLLISVYNYGLKYFILLILITTLTDTFALFGGKLIGKHNFTSISPNKTIEGCIVGSLISTFVSTMYYINIIHMNSNLLLVTSIIFLFTLVGQAGDLFFSAIKREYKKKDFSNLIPGHGGILDRLDSILFVLFAFVALISYL